MNSEPFNSVKDTLCENDKYQNVKIFITAATEYFKHQSETTASALQKSLIVLSTISDLNIFEPGTLTATELYVNLYNLTNPLVSRTPLVWNVLDVLQHACKNSATRYALIHTYKFFPVLSRLLETNLIPEKRLKVLKLLQELSYGEKIQWQEINFPYLVSILTQWIMQSKEEEIVSLSLGVLINLCYKNVAALYTLMRTVDTKALHKMLLKLQQKNVSTRVQCCKLLIIMEQINKDIPDKFILEFVMVTFESLTAALTKSDVLLLRHIVEFFDDVRQNEHSRSILISYPNYFDEVKSILQKLEEVSDTRCTALIMEFLRSLVKLKIPVLIPLYPTYIKYAMHQAQVDYASSKALSLIRTILIESKRNKGFAELVAEIDLSTLILVLGDEDNEMNGKYKNSNELNSRAIELMLLLQEICKIPNCRAQLTVTFSEQTMRRLLSPILKQENTILGDIWPGNAFRDPSTTLYINAITLTADLAVQNSNWLALYSELIQKKQIQMMIAVALFLGDSDVKQKSFQLMTSAGFPQECVTAIVKCMCEVEPLLLIQNKAGANTIIPVKSENNFPIDMTPLFSLSQEGQLDTALETLNNLLSAGKISDISTSMVMELYEYKIAAMKHAEKGIQVSQDAANAYATCLQHRLAQVIVESSRLHQLLFCSQKNNEVLQADKVRMNIKIQEIEDESKKIHALQKQEIHNLKKIVAEKSATIEKLSKLKYDLDVAKEHIAKKDQIIAIKEEEIQVVQDGISALKQENEQLIRQCHNHEQTIAEKEENIQRVTNELVELSRMRDMIFHLTAKKKDDKDETA